MNYYNEFNKFAAAWLRELIKNKLIPEGIVDERSITEIKAEELKEYDQCHFFAGIGGWPYALQLAGIPSSVNLWTGSCPCQPFSSAGHQKGTEDSRHLWPVFHRLIEKRKPVFVFGEQVAKAAGLEWLDFVFDDLEKSEYTVGAAIIPACSVGAPHLRERLFWCGMADGPGDGSGRNRRVIRHETEKIQGAFRKQKNTKPQSGNDGKTGVLGERRIKHGSAGENPENSNAWANPDWLLCRDGYARPVESGTFPVVNGIPSRVDIVHGYGNAIVPQVAAEFVKSFFEIVQQEVI